MERPREAAAAVRGRSARAGQDIGGSGSLLRPDADPSEASTLSEGEDSDEPPTATAQAENERVRKHP